MKSKKASVARYSGGAFPICHSGLFDSFSLAAVAPTAMLQDSFRKFAHVHKHIHTHKYSIDLYTWAHKTRLSCAQMPIQAREHGPITKTCAH